MSALIHHGFVFSCLASHFLVAQNYMAPPRLIRMHQNSPCSQQKLKKNSGEGKVIRSMLMSGCLKMLAKMHPHKLKMHQKAFGGLALLGTAGVAYSTPPDPLAGFMGAYF